MGGGLVTKRVVKYCQRRARLRCIYFSLRGKSGLRLRVMRLILNIIFGGVIIVLTY